MLGKAQLWRAVEASNSSDGRAISLTRTWFSVTPLEAKDALVAWFYFILAWQWGHRARRCLLGVFSTFLACLDPRDPRCLPDCDTWQIVR
jgi:hypothetical protein